MFNNSKVIVLIPAAGSGTRMNSAKNKLLMKIGRDTVMDLTLKIFQKHESVDSIIVITEDEDLKRIAIAYPKTVKIVPGGDSRQESIQKGMDCIEEKNSLIVVHDAARPFITHEIISKVIEKADLHGAAIVAVKTVDTIKKVDDFRVTETLDRSELMNIQTPQVFRYELLKRAYGQECLNAVTDDSSLIEMMNKDVYIVEGSYSNIKITTQSDISYANFMSKGELKMDYRVGIGYDVHQFTEGRPLFLGGVEIPYRMGLLGHSDADVLLHAIMDALLGATALGDIGRLFPDSEDRYDNISSLKLLKEVAQIIGDNGYIIKNIDAVVIAERPKIAPYIEAMVSAISSTIDIEASRINIKGTTTEKLGFEGRGEGISAQAVVMVDKI